ncbi:Predicted oxidoreductase [Ceraceosorus bombacis]|uniref:Predicted oxidoreductase n=1 Tax=Ceraceosorus bombacis TaxID=401625 RepID=A0A0N7L917_9BASI|nr:Predicted oxidoreductase [Ceraceosorus bombacis]
MPIAPAQDPPESYWGALPTLEQVVDVSSADGEAARPNRSLREDVSPIVFGGGILRLGDGQYRDTSEEKVKGLDSFRVVHLALSYGINAIDTSAYYYPSEILLGRILRLLSPLHPRSSYRLLTKCGRYGPSLEHFDYSPKGVRESVGKSLKRLNTSYLDQVLLHDVEFVAEKVGASHEQGFDARDAARCEASSLAVQKSLGLSAASWGTSYGPGDTTVLGALRELFNLKDEGLILNVGISGYPLPVLLRISRLAYIELGRPLDCVLSYSQDCLHSDLLRAWKGLFEMDQRQCEEQEECFAHEASLKAGGKREEKSALGAHQDHLHPEQRPSESPARSSNTSRGSPLPSVRPEAADDPANSDSDWLHSDDEHISAPSALPSNGQAILNGRSEAVQSNGAVSRSISNGTGNGYVRGNGAGPSSRQPQAKADQALSMGQRDRDRIGAKFYDAGYREGITAGKESAIQSGFDEAFEQVGAPVGRRVGRLRGRTATLLQFLSNLSAEDQRMSSNAPSSKERSAQTQQLQTRLRVLISELSRLKLAQLAEPDYEALEHEGEHALGDGEHQASTVVRETPSERKVRENILIELEDRADDLNQQVLSLAQGDASIVDDASRTSLAERNGKWTPPLLLNGSPFSMGLLTEGAVPDWHPASQELKDACLRAAQTLRSASNAPRDAALSGREIVRGVHDVNAPDLAQTALFYGLRSAADWASGDRALQVRAKERSGPERHHGTGFPTLVGMATCDHVHAAIQTMRVLMARTSAQNSCETSATNGASNGERQSGALQDVAEGSKSTERRRLLEQYDVLEAAEKKVKDMVRESGYADWSWASG